MWRLLLLLPFALFAQVKEAHTIEELKEFLEEVTPQDLVLFDIDYTLIMPSDALWHRSRMDSSRLTLREVCQLRYRELYSKMLSDEPWQLVHVEMPSIVESVRAKGAMVMALTGWGGKSFGCIHSIPHWRADQLAEFGLHFGMEGILFAGGSTKGRVLSDFLDSTGMAPRRILFVDDRLDYIDSVESAMAERGVETLSIHFRLAEGLPHDYDEGVALHQIEHLHQTGEWLCDEEVRECLFANP